MSPSSTKEFYTSTELLKRLENRLGMKMFDYLRNTLKLIPPPIKQSRGKGMIALYSENVLRHLQHIFIEKRRGLTFPQIKEKLKNETREVFEESQFWQAQFNAKTVRLEDFLNEGSLPGSVFKISLDNKDFKIADGRAQKGVLKDELKTLCLTWDGHSMETLKAIKNSIEQLEKIEVNERVLMKIRPS